MCAFGATLKTVSGSYEKVKGSMQENFPAIPDSPTIIVFFCDGFGCALVYVTRVIFEGPIFYVYSHGHRIG